MFQTIEFTVIRFKWIVGSQIEIERFFSLTWILTNLKKCCLQSNNLDKLNFVHNNWLNDLQIGCKPFFNLMELIET